ncbi:MAG TPA: amidohydrolase [Tepiditoga sp.]|nr:amidohydrolase [Tepiditoga sp.]
MSKIFLKNAYVMKSSDSETKKYNIAVNDGKIIKITDENDFFDENGYEIFDLNNKLITPGFINSHSHAVMTYFRGNSDDTTIKEWLFDNMLPREEFLNDEMAYYGAMTGFMEMISSGITTSVDMYMFTDSISKAAADTGIRAYVSRGLSYDTQEGWERRINENIETYKKYNNYDGRIKIGFGPHAPYTVPMEKFRELSEIINDYKESINQIHIYEGLWEKESYKLSDLEETGFLSHNVIAAHCVHADDEDIKILKRNNVTVAHNPSSNMKLGSGTAPIKKFIDSGINVTLGTDGAGSNNSLNILKEAHMASMLQKNTIGPEKIKKEEILKMCWENGAHALNEKIGEIREGYMADLVVFDLNDEEWLPNNTVKFKSHLVYNIPKKSLYATMINGKWVYFDRKFPGINKEDIYEKFGKYCDKIEADFYNYSNNLGK